MLPTELGAEPMNERICRLCNERVTPHHDGETYDPVLD
jgi:hypothetical protein